MLPAAPTIPSSTPPQVRVFLHSAHSWTARQDTLLGKGHILTVNSVPNFTGQALTRLATVHASYALKLDVCFTTLNLAFRSGKQCFPHLSKARLFLLAHFERFQRRTYTHSRSQPTSSSHHVTSKLLRWLHRNRISLTLILYYHRRRSCRHYVCCCSESPRQQQNKSHL